MAREGDVACAGQQRRRGGRHGASAPPRCCASSLAQASAGRALPGGHADRQPRRHHPAGAGRAGAGRCALLRGHAPQPHAARALFHLAADAPLSRAQCRARAAARAGRAGGRQVGGAHQRCRHAAGLRSRLQAGARGDRAPATRVRACRAQRACWRRSPAPGWPPTPSCSRASCRPGRARAARGSRS